MAETIFSALALVVSIVALGVSLFIARGDATARLEQFQFSWTPLVALEGGGNVTGQGGTRNVGCTVHLEGRGFVHNLILNLYVGDVALPQTITVWHFKRAPATQDFTFTYQVQTTVQPNQLVRVEGLFENVFKQPITFTQHGILSASTYTMDFTSGAPSYGWPWKTIKPEHGASGLPDLPKPPKRPGAWVG